MATLSDIQLVLDRSIFVALRTEAIEHGYYPNDPSIDFETEAGMDAYKAALTAIKADKGFSVEILSHSNAQYKSDKKTARITIDPFGLLPSDTGLDTTPHYIKQEDGSYLKKQYPSKFSQYEVAITVSAQTAEQIRVLNALVANALGRRKYIPRFPATALAPSGNIYLENSDSYDDSDIKEGIIEKVYRYSLPEVIDKGEDENVVIAALQQITLEEYILQQLSTTEIIDPIDICDPVTIYAEDGTTVIAIVPAGQSYTMPEGTVSFVSLRNSLGVEQENIPAPGSFNVPKHSIKTQSGATLSEAEYYEDTIVPNVIISNSIGPIDEVEPGSGYLIPDGKILNSLGDKIGTIIGGLDPTIDDQALLNSDGTSIGTVIAGTEPVAPDASVMDSVPTLIMHIPAGSSGTLPNFQVWNSVGNPCTQNRPLSLYLDHTVRAADGRANDVDGTLISLVPSGEQVTIPSGNVNLNGSPYGTVKPGATINVSGGITPSGILYQRPYAVQKISYRTGDLGWHQQNGSFDFTIPANPAVIQCLDMSAVDWVYTLKYDNVFGTKARFTTSMGNSPANGIPYAFQLSDFTQVGAVNWYVIDHLTGMGLYVPNLSTGSSPNWTTVIDLIYSYHTSGFLGFNDWMPMFQQYVQSVIHETTDYYTLGSIFRSGLVSNYYEGTGMWLGDTKASATTVAQAMNRGCRILGVTKTSANYAGYMCRVHY